MAVSPSRRSHPRSPTAHHIELRNPNRQRATSLEVWAPGDDAFCGEPLTTVVGRRKGFLLRAPRVFVPPAGPLDSADAGVTANDQGRRTRWKGAAVRRKEGSEYLRRAPIKRPGLPAFMFGLRNVAQHQRIPLTTSSRKGWRDETGRMISEDYFTVVLDAVRAHNWRSNPDGYAYLESLTEDPRLDVIIPAFTMELLRFAAWFMDELRRVYQQELKELEELHLRHSALIQPTSPMPTARSLPSDLRDALRIAQSSSRNRRSPDVRTASTSRRRPMISSCCEAICDSAVDDTPPGRPSAGRSDQTGAE